MGFKSILSSPFIYRLFSTVVGQGPARDIYVKDWIRPQPGERILDIGCGPGDIVEHLPEYICYVGFDMSDGYINAAQNRFGQRAQFICKCLDEDVLKDQEPFDIVTAIGVLHHLDDKEVLNLFHLASLALKPGGRLITVDPVFYEGQSRFEHWLISKDRGNYIRDASNYIDLIPDSLMYSRSKIYKGILRMPWSLFMAEIHR